jgi:uncharacterized protein YcbK (DUF882 family)
MGPSKHLTWSELSCWNRQPRKIGRHQPGELIATYPREWRETRAIHLADTFEAIRTLLGHKPITINSAYRTPAYNTAIQGAGASQHCQGRAIDITHPLIRPEQLFEAIRELQHAGKLPLLGGLGRYSSFVHIDVRPKINGRLSVW